MNKRAEKDRIAKMRQDHHDALESLSLSNEECLANAQLIAAAPEMLEALAEIQTLTKRNALPSDTRQGWEPVAAERMEKIAKLTRKAITKATEANA